MPILYYTSSVSDRTMIMVTQRYADEDDTDDAVSTI